MGAGVGGGGAAGGLCCPAGRSGLARRGVAPRRGPPAQLAGLGWVGGGRALPSSRGPAGNRRRGPVPPPRPSPPLPAPGRPRPDLPPRHPEWDGPLLLPAPSAPRALVRTGEREPWEEDPGGPGLVHARAVGAPRSGRRGRRPAFRRGCSSHPRPVLPPPCSHPLTFPQPPTEARPRRFNLRRCGLGRPGGGARGVRSQVGVRWAGRCARERVMEPARPQGR